MGEGVTGKTRAVKKPKPIGLLHPCGFNKFGRFGLTAGFIDKGVFRLRFTAFENRTYEHSGLLQGRKSRPRHNFTADHELIGANKSRICSESQREDI